MKQIVMIRQSWPMKLVLLVAGLHFISSTWHILYGGMNSDEGFYAIAARSVWTGELPYRDFGYTQMPLLPYINGVLMKIVGFGLFEQRTVNGVWGALTLVIAAVWVSRRTSTSWALALVTLFSFSAPWMYFIHLGKTYALVGLVAVGAMWIFTEWIPGRRKIIILALLGTIGTGCRLPIAPYFAVLWIAGLIEIPNPSWGPVVYSIACSLLWPAILVLPFFMAAPQQALFWTLEFHHATLADRTWHLPWQIIFCLAPILWLGLSGCALHVIIRRDLPQKKEFIAAIATLAALAGSLLPLGVFEEYAVPLLPPLAMITISGIWHAARARAQLHHAVVPFILLIGNLTLSVAIQWRYLPLDRQRSWSMFLPLKAPAYNFLLPEEIAQSRKIVEEYLPWNQSLIGPMIILAAEAKRRVPKNLRLGPFSVTTDFPPVKAHLLNLATLPEVESYLTDPNVHLLALSKNPYNNYSCSMPSFDNLSRDKSFLWSDYFRKEFIVRYETDDFFILTRRTTTKPQ